MEELSLAPELLPDKSPAGIGDLDRYLLPASRGLNGPRIVFPLNANSSMNCRDSPFEL